MSTESGIPDFRSATGVWAEVDPFEVASIDAFRRDPLRVWRWYGPRVDGLLAARPNAGHEALAALESGGFVRAVLTQNIDTLHARAGSASVVELHARSRASRAWRAARASRSRPSWRSCATARRPCALPAARSSSPGSSCSGSCCRSTRSLSRSTRARGRCPSRRRLVAPGLARRGASDRDAPRRGCAGSAERGRDAVRRRRHRRRARSGRCGAGGGRAAPRGASHNGADAAS